MEKIKSLASKYWWVAIPLALFGGWMVWQMYVKPRVVPAPAAQ